MIPVLSPENMKKSLNAAFARGMTPEAFAERAAIGFCRASALVPPVAILCTTGSADIARATAKRLRASDCACALFICGENGLSGEDRRENADGGDLPVFFFTEQTDLSGYASIVDCLSGVCGADGSDTSLEAVGADRPDGSLRAAIDAIGGSGAYIVSFDMNGGLDARSGMGENCVRSDLTVAAGFYRPGHFLSAAMDVMKKKTLFPLEITPAEEPYWLIGERDAAAVFGERRHFSHKGTYGYTVLIGGSEKYSGALRLSATAHAAMRSGAGVVRAAFPRSLYHEIAPALLESTAFPLPDKNGEVVFDEEAMKELTAGVTTVAFGMGIGRSAGAREILRWLLRSFSGRLIVDADGLFHLACLARESVPKRSCELLLTPHIGEFSRLSGRTAAEILRDPVGEAMRAAKDLSCAILLKGPTTVVTDGARVFLCDAGCPGMATAGSGDVLSGILAAVLSVARDLLSGAAAGAYVNGKAGEAAQRAYGAVSMIARDTVSFLPEVIGKLTAETTV